MPKKNKATKNEQPYAPRWERYFDQESHAFYYYNVETKVSQWEKPEELMTEAQQQKIQLEKQKQKDFFHKMEQTIFTKLSSGKGTLKLTRSQHNLFSAIPPPKTCQTPVPSHRKPSQVSETLLHLAVSENGRYSRRSLSSSALGGSTLFNKNKPSIERRCSIADSGCKSSQKSKRSTLRRCNTTSTVYMRWSLSSPDVSTLILCVCAVIRAKMVETSCRPFNHNPDNHIFQDTQMNQAPSSCLPSSWVGENDEEIAMEMPTFEEVCSYFNHIVKRSQLDTYLPAAVLISLIYIERLTSPDQNGKVLLSLHPNNWRSIVLISLVMANKMWDDLSVKNEDFCTVCPEYDIKRLNKLEVAFVAILKYDINVKPSEYARYYFQLRSYAAIIGVEHEVFTQKPLNTQVLKTLKEKHAAIFGWKCFGSTLPKKEEECILPLAGAQPSAAGFMTRNRQRSTSQGARRIARWVAAKGEEYCQRFTTTSEPPNASIEEILA